MFHNLMVGGGGGGGVVASYNVDGKYIIINQVNVVNAKENFTADECYMHSCMYELTSVQFSKAVSQ